MNYEVVSIDIVFEFQKGWIVKIVSIDVVCVWFSNSRENHVRIVFIDIVFEFQKGGIGQILSIDVVFGFQKRGTSGNFDFDTISKDVSSIQFIASIFGLSVITKFDKTESVL